MTLAHPAFLFLATLPARDSATPRLRLGGGSCFEKIYFEIATARDARRIRSDVRGPGFHSQSIGSAWQAIGASARASAPDAPAIGSTRMGIQSAHRAINPGDPAIRPSHPAISASRRTTSVTARGISPDCLSEKPSYWSKPLKNRVLCAFCSFCPLPPPAFHSNTPSLHSPGSFRVPHPAFRTSP